MYYKIPLVISLPTRIVWEISGSVCLTLQYNKLLDD